MISDTALAIVVAVGAPTLLGLMLLPTVLELRKASDAGPRLIMYNYSILSNLSQLTMAPIVDIEEQFKLNLVLVPVITEIIKTLPSIES
jgi:hypothetical protein